MTMPLDFIHDAKPDRTEIGQFNKSATISFLEWFDATLARDKRRFPKGCGFAWFLLEQMLKAYLQKYPENWQRDGERSGSSSHAGDMQGRLVLALIDDNTKQQRLHQIPDALWQRILAYRSEQQPNQPVFATIEHLLARGCDAS